MGEFISITRQGEPLRAYLGIEAIVVMKDVCHLDDDEVLAQLRWTSTTMLRAALADAEATGDQL